MASCTVKEGTLFLGGFVFYRDGEAIDIDDLSVSVRDWVDKGAELGFWQNARMSILGEATLIVEFPLSPEIEAWVGGQL